MQKSAEGFYFKNIKDSKAAHMLTRAIKWQFQKIVKADFDTLSFCFSKFAVALQL